MEDWGCVRSVETWLPGVDVRGFPRLFSAKFVPCRIHQARTSEDFRTSVSSAGIDAVEMGGPADGKAPVFVLVHGLGMSGRYMMPTANLLSPWGRVHVPDLPGFGKSAGMDRIPTIPELATSLAGWLEEKGIENPILIGNSLGAQVIVDLAVSHPSRLSAAVLVGLTIDPEARRVSTQIGRLLRDIPREPVALYRIAVTDYFRAGFRRCLRTLRHALADPVADKLPGIQVPVLVLRGEKDPIVPAWWNERAAERIPNATCVTIPDAAHAVNFSAGEALVGEVARFRCSVFREEK